MIHKSSGERVAGWRVFSILQDANSSIDRRRPYTQTKTNGSLSLQSASFSRMLCKVFVTFPTIQFVPCFLLHAFHIICSVLKWSDQGMFSDEGTIYIYIYFGASFFRQVLFALEAFNKRRKVWRLAVPFRQDRPSRISLGVGCCIPPRALLPQLAFSVRVHI